jgi:hypothetical protein
LRIKADIRVENGTVRGIDYGGFTYSGTISLKIKYHVPTGGQLVQGVAPQDLPYDKFIEQEFPPLFGDGNPVETAKPPVTVMVRRLPPDSNLLDRLGLK